MARRTFISTLTVAAALLAGLALVLSGAIAGARTTRQVRTIPVLSMARGSFEVSLGSAPAWLPLSSSSETLTLIGGAPRRGRGSGANAYVGFVDGSRACSAAPAGARRVYGLADFYSSAHSAARHAGAFAPGGGAPSGTYIASVGGVRVSGRTSVRACVWLAGSASSHAGSLVASEVLPLLNRTFAASVSNVSAGGAGSGGLTMFAFDGGQAFRYTATSSQCGVRSGDGSSRVAPGTPASESVSINASPCSGDESSFHFSGPRLSSTLTYPFSDALADPPVTVSTGACELDPLTGASLLAAQHYLAAVGCRVGRVEVSPYTRTLTRGDVAWASVDGGVAEIAPRHTAVDLVLNGRP